MKFDIYIQQDNRAACPLCGGVLIKQGDIGRMKCYDCGERYKAVSVSEFSDRTLVYEKEDKE